jgi:hypothetical protein
MAQMGHRKEGRIEIGRGVYKAPHHAYIVSNWRFTLGYELSTELYGNDLPAKNDVSKRDGPEGAIASMDLAYRSNVGGLRIARSARQRPSG